MNLVIAVLSGLVALSSIGLATSGHRSLGGSAPRTDSAFTCSTPAPGDDLLGGQPSHC
jgi:hypothetical protein